MDRLLRINTIPSLGLAHSGNGTNIAAKQAIEERQRIIETPGVRRGDGLLDVARIKLKTAAFCVLLHPGERNIRKPAVWVAAANIRVNAREPDLLNALPGIPICFPECGCKRLSALVDRYRMK